MKMQVFSLGRCGIAINARYFGIEHAYAEGKARARATPTGRKPVAALGTKVARRLAGTRHSALRAGAQR